MKYTLDYKKYAELARRVAAEGSVLLRNEDEVLPLQKGQKVSIFGRTQFEHYKSGTGSGGMVNAPYVTNITDSLKEDGTVQVNEALETQYREWLKDHPFDVGEGWAMEPWNQEEMPISEELAAQASEQSDLAIVVIGRTAGEDKDNSATEGSYLLTAAEEEILRNVCHAFEQTIVVLNVGNIMDMKWVDRYQPQAVLYVWQGGQEGGRAAADVLTGKVNPGGKLSDTIAVDIEDYPSTENFGDPVENFYTEDIYVGYRYFETFARDKVKYPFGFGLSYTRFQTETMGLAVRGTEVTAIEKVTNVGGVSGRETIQVYVEAPQGKLGKPLRQLVAYAKTEDLKPGESEELVLKAELTEFASYDDSGVTGHKSCYVLEAGDYIFYVGTDVRSAREVGRVTLAELQVVRTATEALAPVQAFKRLRPFFFGENDHAIANWEDVPLRTIDLAERILRERPTQSEYVGDQGWKLADVYDNKITLEQFLTQLSDEDLICMTRGEGMCSPKVTPGTAAAFGGMTDGLQQFGIPVACCSDGPSGIRMDCGTMAYALPNGTLLACTFDPELVEELYEMEGMELRKNKIDSLLGPGINIHRNPLNGRNFEYFSEDPYLTGTMAAAQLKGMGKYGVTGTIKHFACNNQEYKRHDANSIVSERALREIYLKGFEIAVKQGGAYSIMSTYGPLNGLWTAGNYDLLTTILRKEWGYQGIVMTDWWAKINEEGGPGSKSQTVPMVRAQNDIYMVTADATANSNQDNTAEGLADGRLTRAQLTRNATNICRFLLRSVAMERLLGREKEECTELHSPVSTEGAGDSGQVLARLELPEPKLGEEVELPLEKLSTKKGTSAVYQLRFPRIGRYELVFRMSSTLGPLAQLPISVFMNNTLQQTVTINGTEGKVVEQTVTLAIRQDGEKYMKLYFGESGIDMHRMFLRYVGKNDVESFRNE